MIITSLQNNTKSEIRRILHEFVNKGVRLNMNYELYVSPKMAVLENDRFFEKEEFSKSNGSNLKRYEFLWIFHLKFHVPRTGLYLYQLTRLLTKCSKSHSDDEWNFYLNKEIKWEKLLFMSLGTFIEMVYQDRFQSKRISVILNIILAWNHNSLANRQVPSITPNG